MNRLAAFFHGSDAQLGVFYPRNYLLAAFPDWATAREALLKFRNHGYSEEEVLAVSGTDVVEFAHEYLKRHGLWSFLMTELSRFFDTEAPYADHDLDLARRGAGFLAVYCPTPHEKARAWKKIESLRPMVARYYTASGVEHLAGEN